MKDPILVIHEVRDKAHRLIVEDQKSKWCGWSEFAMIESIPGEGYAASPPSLRFSTIPEIFHYKSVWATEVKPTEVQPVDDEDLPTL